MHADLMARSDHPTALQITQIVRAGIHSEKLDRGCHRQRHRTLQRSSCVPKAHLLYLYSLDKQLQRLQVHQGGGLDLHIEGLRGAPVVLDLGLQGNPETSRSKKQFMEWNRLDTIWPGH